MSVDSVFQSKQEGAISVATAIEVKELSVPQQIRNKSEQARQYRDHCRDLRKQYDRDAQDREANHQKLIASGEGPCDGAEVLRLQKSRWQILADNEKALNGLVRELGELKQHLDDEYRLCGQMVDQYRDAEVQRLVDDFGHRPVDAKNKVDHSEALQQLKRETHKIHDLSEDVLKMINAANSEIDAIASKKSQLSKSWRTF